VVVRLGVFLSETKSQMLRVPVTRAEVEIFTDRDHENAFIFLPPDFTPEDIFDDESRFFPADVGGTIRLFARSSVVSVAISADDAPPASSETLGLPYEDRAVRVRLGNGRTLVGTVRCPSGKSRTLDFLNQASKSFTLHADGKVHHIAKAHVDYVEEAR
jgi:hypothetical protein